MNIFVDPFREFFDGTWRQKHNKPMPEGLTTEEAAEELGTTPMAIRKMLDRGYIKGRKHGSMWFIPREELEKVRNRKRGPKPKTTP